MGKHKMLVDNVRGVGIKEGIIEETQWDPLVRYFVYEPGNGTRYPLLFTPLDYLNPQATGAGSGAGYTLVSLCWGPKDIRSYAFKNTGFLHWDKVRKELKLNGIPDAIVLAEFIALQLGREAMSVQEAVDKFNTRDEDDED